MNLETVDIQEKFRDVLRDSGIKTLNPVQKLSVESGLLDLDKNFVVSAPTASGKTLIAEMFMIKALLQKKQKAMYIVPLRALANEKYESFKERYGRLGISVAISTGDMDNSDQWLNRYDVIVLTSEKMDSLLRHKAQWMDRIGVVIVDEVHLLNDPGRGPTLEVVVTRLRRLNPSMRFLFLSATISNARELADWIGAKLVRSDWRPVKLKEGVYDGESVQFADGDTMYFGNDEPAEVLIASDTAEKQKQALVFASTRRNAEAISERCAEAVKKHLSEEEVKKLAALAERIERALDSPTKQCSRLAKVVRSGAAFHHAGLVAEQRKLIEGSFREKLIKAVVATPTLAMGVDLPAYRVIIRDCRRFAAGYGWIFIPVLEYEQMRGRAGRPRWDSEGESILVAHNPQEAEELTEHFINGEMEEITSKLAVEPVLRVHTLALVATELAKTEDELLDFYLSTFWGFQFKDPHYIRATVGRILDELAGWKFIIRIGKELRPTQVGKRVSELYIDPATAATFLESLENYSASAFGLLQLIASTPELAPVLSVSDKEIPDLQSALSSRGLMRAAPDEWDVEYESFIGSAKTAIMLENWVEEKGEDAILVRFRVSPGELRARLDNADWLLYAIDQLAQLSGKRAAQPAIRKLRLRAKYGIKEELLPLVRLRGIGRVRARLLFNSGLRTVQDLKNIVAADLARLVGPAVAKNIKEQVESGAGKRGFEEI